MSATDTAVVIGVLILIVVGFATSYRTLLELAITAGGYPPWLAPAVPLSFDLGIVVLSLKVAQAAREGRRAPLLRLLVMALSGATVMANASAVPGLAGRVRHAVPPAIRWSPYVADARGTDPSADCREADVPWAPIRAMSGGLTRQ